jgi:hypothetical protein
MVRRASLLASLGLLAFAPPAFGQLAVSQVASADPVGEGESVTYAVTVTNQGATAENVALTLQTTKSNDDSPVENQYVSLTSSVGSCSVDQPQNGFSRGGRCALGSLANGASVQVQGVVVANFSMNHIASLATCDATGEFCFPQTSSELITTVTHPPTLSGSKKITVKGLPSGCATADFKAKAKAKGKGVKSVSASLSGPRDEYGAPLDGFKSAKRLAKKQGRKVKPKVKAGGFQRGFYELDFIASRKGSPNLKRTATFQVC